MDTVQAIKSVLSEKLNELHKFGVSEIWLFGSAARGQADYADLDFLVSFSQPPGLVEFMVLKFYLEALFGKPVDLHTKQSCPERFYKRIENELRHVA